MVQSQRIVNLAGPLTVAGCEGVKLEVAAALDEADLVELAVDPDAETDLTFLQLLIAAERTAAGRGKQVRLQAPPAGAFAQALAACGFAVAPGATSLGQIFAHSSGRV